MTELLTQNNKLQVALEKLFQQHRLVFWYDDKADMTDLFNSLDLAGVNKLVIDNNEFSLKHLLLIEQPRQQFLIYQAKAKPTDNENWLLDIVLSNHEFHTEASSLYLQDLGLPAEFKGLIQEHEAFFNNQKYLTELKTLLEPEDRESKMRLKMLSVICNCEAEWEKIMYALFAESLKQKNDKYKLIERFILRGYFWEVVEKKYNYKSLNPTVKDCLLQLIQDNYARSIPEGKPTLNKDAYLFVNRWKENTKAKSIFSEWSHQLEKELSIESAIQNQPLEALLNADTYAVIDKKIIVGIRDHIVQNTLSNYVVQEWIEKRRVKFFFSDFTHLYEALNNAAILLDAIRNADLTIQNPKHGFEQYEKHWYKLDQLYRKYIYASEQAEHQNILKDLTKAIEKAYSNAFLLPLGDNWQKAIDGVNMWGIDGVIGQKQFYSNWISAYTKRENTRIFVIISDALRYESAAELREMILNTNRYTAKLTPVLGSLPSYTQLGMASLLPHKSLTFDEPNDTVYADGFSTKGTDNRTKVLQRTHAGSIAIQAEDFLKPSIAEGRDFIKPYQVVYIYHNHIDKTGDDKTSESKVFEATETELKYLLEVIRRIYNLNGTNMLITADHGYLYQHNRLETSDFTGFTPIGKTYKISRRFVLGKDLKADAAVQKWTGKALGFGDDTEALIPKSINRLRIQGAGSRFVHGGSSLQEVVIPVLEIRNTRKEDVTQVEIDLISGSSNITSNTFAVSFYQKQPVADKIQPRQLKAGFYTEGGKLISTVVTLLFNTTDKDALAREKRQSFLFTADASKYNGQDVYLKLEEQIDGTHQLKTYKSMTYRMLIAFSSEFDDF